MTKPHLAVISHVYPFPGNAGQQQRVRHKLDAFRERFHVTLITVGDQGQITALREQLLSFCDEVIILPSQYSKTFWSKIVHRLWGTLWAWWSGLKFSNYLIGQVEFSPARIAKYLEEYDFDGVVFEYWHAAATAVAFQAQDIPCVLDMHNILWRAYARQLISKPFPDWYKRRAIYSYRQNEEQAWTLFDGLITINAAEHDYVHNQLPTQHLFYTPMGVDLEKWSYAWSPVRPPRIIYYGSLGSEHNQRDAWHCYTAIMPQVWSSYPEAELWLVGNNPSAQLQQIAASEPRVQVTGFVDNIQTVLATASLVLCPWTGRYGFRSRLIEVMALGVPVVTTGDAIYGMNLQGENGILLGESNEQLAHQVLRLLDNPAFANEQSQLAHQAIIEQYSFAATYERLSIELWQWLLARKQRVFAVGRS